MRKQLIGLSALLVWHCNTALAQDTFQWSGYLQGVWQSKAVTGSDSRRLGLNDNFGEAGITLDSRLNERLSLKAQARARAPQLTQNSIAYMDVLSLHFQAYQAPWGYIRVSGGRLKNALIGFYSAQDDPFARPMTTHSRVYLGNIPQIFSSMDGGRLGISWASKTGHGVDFYLYGGQRHLDVTVNSPKNNLTAKNKSYNLRAAKIIYTSPTLPVIQTGLVAVNVDLKNQINFSRIFLDNRSQGNVFIGMGRISGLRWELTGEYAWGNVKGSLTSPQLPALSGVSHASFSSAYIELSWLPNPKWRSSLRYAHMDYPQLAYRQLRRASSSDHIEGLIIYARRKINRSFFVGLELDSIKINRSNSDQQTHAIALVQAGLHF